MVKNFTLHVESDEVGKVLVSGRRVSSVDVETTSSMRATGSVGTGWLLVAVDDFGLWIVPRLTPEQRRFLIPRRSVVEMTLTTSELPPDDFADSIR